MNHEEWLKESKGIEGHTKQGTLDQECQKNRIKWIVENVHGSVLEMGCNWGYITNAICEKLGRTVMGVDVNSANIVRATNEFPDLYFFVADITKKIIWLADRIFDTVILPDVLEHLPFMDVGNAIEEAGRLTKNLILITLPWEESKRTCFKHRWEVNMGAINLIITKLRGMDMDVYTFCDNEFYYINAFKLNNGDRI